MINASTDADSANEATETPLKVGIRNIDRSMSGDSARRSTNANVASSSTAAARDATITPFPQPLSLPRIKPNASRKMPTEKVTAPAKSILALGPEMFTSRRSVRAMATSPIGTFT